MCQTTPNPTYTFTASDKAAGYVNLTLQGPTIPWRDNSRPINNKLSKKPVVVLDLQQLSPGSIDQHQFRLPRVIQLTQAGELQWNRKFTNANTLITTYNPSPADRAGTNNPIIITLVVNRTL